MMFSFILAKMKKLPSEHVGEDSPEGTSPLSKVSVLYSETQGKVMAVRPAAYIRKAPGVRRRQRAEAVVGGHGGCG